VLTALYGDGGETEIASKGEVARAHVALGGDEEDVDHGGGLAARRRPSGGYLYAQVSLFQSASLSSYVITPLLSCLARLRSLSSPTMPPKFYVPVLISGMILTGACNSIWSKFQDMQCVENCDDPDPKKRLLYEQPVWQTLQMFLGEMLCFLPVLWTYIASRRTSAVQLPEDADDDAPALHTSPDNEEMSGVSMKVQGQQLKGWRVLLLWLPAMCDLTGTTLMNIGLLYTPVSIYQMTRGALVLFVGILSVLFLHRRLWLYQWLSLITVMAGVSLVGFSGSLIKDTLREDTLLSLNATSAILSGRADDPVAEPIEKPEATKVLIGIFFILFAQIFTATQFVVEEKLLSRYTVAPLLAVGYEGLFGTISILILMPLLPLLPVSPDSPAAPWFDLPRGLHQLLFNPPVLWSGVVVALSISLFNYFGLSVTRHVSATARSLTDTCRTLVIWIVSLGLGWEMLVWPISLAQVAGFGLLVYGTFLFNNLVNPPRFLLPAEVAQPAESDVTPLLYDEEAEEALEETAVLPADLGQSGYDVVPAEQLARTRSKSAARA
ncbi:hypothetical protein EVG20_g10963, partial [Dentipellis fragilis]